MISFKDKVNNLIQQNKSVSLRFLSLQEQQLIQKQSNIILYGGYNDAELKRAYINKDVEDDIVCFKIRYNDTFLTLSHQNILGSLLALSITRDSIGDILPKQSLFFLTKEISNEILQSFTSIGKHPIELEAFHGVIQSEKEIEEFRTTLESMRLDLVVSKIAKISRSEASSMIKNELIKVNHTINTKPTTKLNEQDVLSIRKSGRYIVINNQNTSKKGKIILIYGKYI